jgi:predicted dienelactone hydrolase
MTRIFFIHGYGELPTVFDYIAPHLPGNHQMINVWEELKPVPLAAPLNAPIFAQMLIDKYQITAADIIVGHSMGGWIAVHIKQAVGATALQVASFTNQQKILVPNRSMGVIRFLHYNGLYLNAFTSWLFSNLVYKGLASRTFFEETVKRLITSDKDEVYKQLRILFEPVPPLRVEPDLRIHAKADKVLAPPDEPYHRVPGDHFTLVTQPEAVWKPLLEALQQTKR